MTNDIGQFISEDSETVKAIYAWHKKQGDSEAPRKYLGASIIGHHCERYLWFNFRLLCKEDFEGRMYRLFETGHLEEPRFCRELRGIGCEVHEVNEDGGQFAISCFGGHCRGHMDGTALGIPEAPKTWHLLEMKTHSKKSFIAVKKDGVEKSKPMHFAQMQIYMGIGGLKRGLYMAKNKDTDEIYTERIRLDGKVVKDIADKAKRIIESSLPPARITDRCDDYRCRFCCARDLCFGTGDVCLPIPYRSCRSCCHATPIMDGDDGEWRCEKYDVVIAEKGRLHGCPDHLIIPGIIADVDVNDAGPDYIEFKADNGVPFICRNDLNSWTTAELMKTSRDTVFSAAANEAKKVIGGKVIQENKPEVAE